MSTRGWFLIFWCGQYEWGVACAGSASPAFRVGTVRAEPNRDGPGPPGAAELQRAEHSRAGRAEPDRAEPKRTGPGAAEPVRSEPSGTESGRRRSGVAGSSRTRSERAERSREQPNPFGASRAEQPNPLGPVPSGHGADRVGHVGERAGAGRRAHPADGRHRGRGGAVQGLVLRGLLHRCRRPGVPARVSQEQTEKGLHHGEVWPEVPDSRGEAAGAPHQELLRPSHPPRCPGCPCRIPPLHHPGHRLPGHCQRHLPAGRGARGGVETHRAEAPGEAPRRGHHEGAPQQPPAPAAPRRPQEAAGAGGAGEPHPRGGGVMGIPCPALLLLPSCSWICCSHPLGSWGPQNPAAGSPQLLGSSVPMGSPRDPQNPSDALGSPALLGVPNSPAMLSSL